jgi:hypothetical protein
MSNFITNIPVNVTYTTGTTTTNGTGILKEKLKILLTNETKVGKIVYEK